MGKKSNIERKKKKMKSMNNDDGNNNNWLGFSLSPNMKMEVSSDPHHHHQHQTHSSSSSSTSSAAVSHCVPTDFFHSSPYGIYYGGVEGENGGFYSPLSVMPLKSDGSLCIMEALSRSQPQGKISFKHPLYYFSLLVLFYFIFFNALLKYFCFLFLFLLFYD